MVVNSYTHTYVGDALVFEGSAESFERIRSSLRRAGGHGQRVFRSEVG